MEGLILKGAKNFKALVGAPFPIVIPTPTVPRLLDGSPYLPSLALTLPTTTGHKKTLV